MLVKRLMFKQLGVGDNVIDYFAIINSKKFTKNLKKIIKPKFA